MPVSYTHLPGSEKWTGSNVKIQDMDFQVKEVLDEFPDNGNMVKNILNTFCLVVRDQDLLLKFQELQQTYYDYYTRPRHYYGFNIDADEETEIALRDLIAENPGKPEGLYSVESRAGGIESGYTPVSYTHLDVYKRQLSGLPARRFCFEAFLPADKKQRQAVLKELKTETRTILLYEAPHRLVRTLEILLGELGNRRATVCRELTKKHETVFVTTLEEALRQYQASDPRGECVIVVEGRSQQEIEAEKQAEWQEMELEEHMKLYLDSGHDRKEAMRLVAKDRGISKREVYQQLLTGEG